MWRKVSAVFGINIATSKMYRYRPYVTPGKAEWQKTALKTAMQVALLGGTAGISMMLIGLAVSLH